MVIFLVFFSSCRKTDVAPIQWDETGNIALGKKLENPYTVENMQQAYLNLKSAGKDIPDYSIATTHYYVRFLPLTMEEYELLENVTLIRKKESPGQPGGQFIMVGWEEIK
jgi:hypothetical protein